MINELLNPPEILAPILVTPARDALEVPLGSNVTFSVFATGYNLLYLWELDSGESLPTSDSRYLGVRSSRLTISDVRTSDAGAYVCMVSNSGGSVRSTATLTISKLLNIGNGTSSDKNLKLSFSTTI